MAEHGARGKNGTKGHGVAVHRFGMKIAMIYGVLFTVQFCTVRCFPWAVFLVEMGRVAMSFSPAVLTLVG